MGEIKVVDPMPEPLNFLRLEIDHEHVQYVNLDHVVGMYVEAIPNTEDEHDIEQEQQYELFVYTITGTSSQYRMDRQTYEDFTHRVMRRVPVVVDGMAAE
jgi:hypothetical protein